MNLRRLEVLARPRRSKAACAALGLATQRPLGLWLYRSKSLAELLKHITSEEAYDSCLILGDICMAQYADSVGAKRKIWDICDDPVLAYRRRAAVVTDHLLKRYYQLQARIIRAYTRKVAPAFDRILVIAEKDARSLGRLCPNRLIEVPNAVDTERFRPARRAGRNGKRILLTGAMRSWANREAARFFVERVLPVIQRGCGKVTFEVVGDGADRLALGAAGSVVLTGFVQDLSPYYRTCDVFVCPLTVGTGVKNKLLEAMASGCAIVTTSVGAEGLGVTDRHELLIADSPAEFASAVQLLLADTRLRQRLGANARRLAEQRFSSARTTERVLAALSE
jgi:glycosyltransferase involved in cell wall biosynthesis